MKLWNYLVIITGMALLMDMMGFSDTSFGVMFQAIGIVSQNGIVSLTQASYWSHAFNPTTGILTLAAAGGSLIAIGLAIYTKDKAYTILPLLVGVLSYWLSVMLGVMNYATNYSGVFAPLVFLILIPLNVGFIQSMFDYYYGVL